MIKNVKQACRFNPVIQDYRMSQAIENLADLINDEADGQEFFSRNYVTHGMEQLFREGMLRLSGNEIYEILKKRLIGELPDERTVADIAEEYAKQVRKAEEGGYIIAASIERIAEQVRETYPFHPSFKHLVALFKENEGFPARPAD